MINKNKKSTEKLLMIDKTKNSTKYTIIFIAEPEEKYHS